MLSCAAKRAGCAAANTPKQTEWILTTRSDRSNAGPAWSIAPLRSAKLAATPRSKALSVIGITKRAQSSRDATIAPSARLTPRMIWRTLQTLSSRAHAHAALAGQPARHATQPALIAVNTSTPRCFAPRAKPSPALSLASRASSAQQRGNNAALPSLAKRNDTRTNTRDGHQHGQSAPLHPCPEHSPATSTPWRNKQPRESARTNKLRPLLVVRERMRA